MGWREGVVQLRMKLNNQRINDPVERVEFVGVSMIRASSFSCLNFWNVDAKSQIALVA